MMSNDDSQTCNLSTVESDALTSMIQCLKTDADANKKDKFTGTCKHNLASINKMMRADKNAI